ncbi:interleukin-13 receptor subunit alpha-1 isoform X2 [Siniperca chuatsi]|nr:interleukin-13 receptor subunit alpha-1 isoform X2 [Siniperca chuatsi]
MEGGSLQMSVETVCNSTHSKPALFNIMYPELVNKLECCIFSSKQSHCSWLPASQAPDLRFFYALQNEDLGTSIYNDALSVLQECSSYSYTNSTRTGCDLQGHFTQAIIILFNGTLNNKPVRNTFRKEFNKCVKLPPLEWTVTKTEDKFIIRWIAPDIVSLPDWKFQIIYTECNDRKIKDVEGNTSVDLVLVPHCPYRMAIKAETQGGRKIYTTGIDEKYFDADTDPKMILILTSIIIPLMFAGLAALTFMYFSKNKEKMFPKVPQPRDLLSDISDNNNKSTVHNLYIPAEEEDNCKITLVIDPQTNQI